MAAPTKTWARAAAAGQSAAPTPKQKLVALTASLVGKTVKVKTTEGKIYQGVVSAASPQGTGYVLSKAFLVENFDEKAAPTPSSPVDQLVLQPANFAELIEVKQASSKPMEAKGGEAFTDSAITAGKSAAPPSGSAGRVFEPWSGGLGPDIDINSGGWSAADMRAVNETRFGVRSTYNELHYTTAVDTSAPDYEEKRRQADRIARSLETSRSGRADQRGDEASEEERYSSVLGKRPQPAHIDGTVLDDAPEPRSNMVDVKNDLKNFSEKFKLAPTTPEPPAASASVPAPAAPAATSPTPRAASKPLNPNAAPFNPTSFGAGAGAGAGVGAPMQYVPQQQPTYVPMPIYPPPPMRYPYGYYAGYPQPHQQFHPQPQ